METSDLITPQIGTTCPALKKEDYEYHLSGDCTSYCICLLTNKPCIGRRIADPQDRTSQFFSRAKCMISQKGLHDCPIYGVSKDLFVEIFKDKANQEINRIKQSYTL